MMMFRPLLPFCVAPLLAALVLSATARVAHADQRRDFMLEQSGEFGQHLIADYFGTGGQLTLEHRGGIYGRTNDYAFRASTLVGYPLAQANLSASLRVLFFEIGASIGYRAVWRNLSFEPGEHSYCDKCDRPARRDRDPILGSGPDTDRYLLSSAYVQMYAPMNEYFVLSSLLSADYQGVKPRTYDQFNTDIHDGGVMIRWETAAFIKHRDWGGIGPYVQLLSLPRAGHHETEVAYGFNAVTRPGLLTRNDTLLITFLMRPGDGYYGQHSYYMPVRALAIWRFTLTL
jgi:hypothetical protein